jgi:hypothetical protein
MRHIPGEWLVVEIDSNPPDRLTEMHSLNAPPFVLVVGATDKQSSKINLRRTIRNKFKVNTVPTPVTASQPTCCFFSVMLTVDIPIQAPLSHVHLRNRNRN